MSQTPEPQFTEHEHEGNTFFSPAPPQTPALKKHDLISTKTGNVIHRVLDVFPDGSMKIKVSSAPNRECFTVPAYAAGEWIRRG